MPQPGLFYLDERYARLNERAPLVKLNQILDQETFREPLSVLRNPPRKSQVGPSTLRPGADVQDSAPSASVQRLR